MVAKKEKKKGWSVGSLILLVVCAIVFCGSAGYIGLYLMNNMSAEKEFKALSEAGENKLLEAYQKNTDTIGWITVEDTNINYPVMYTPDESEFYLHRDFDKEYSEAGTPFLDGDTVTEGEGESWNYFIYGHNMKYGSMFHDLLEFEDSDFMDSHNAFSFDIVRDDDGNTEVEEGTYQVVAVARSEIKSKSSTEFKYYKYIGLSDEESFNEYIDGILDESMYDFGIVPEYGDQLVTLSTCAYHTDEGRFFVVGVKIQD